MIYENEEPYHISFKERALKQLEKLDNTAKAQIYKYLTRNTERNTNPRQYGGPLHGSLKSAWKYTIGTYRVICDINDDDHEVLIIKIAHRSDVYQGK